MLYMMFFYTDISAFPLVLLAMFLLWRVRLMPSPLHGPADLTHPLSRRANSDHRCLFGALPFGIVCVLAYRCADLNLNGKMIYAAIAYTLLYTVVNIPYCALGVITNDLAICPAIWRPRFVLATAGGMCFHRTDDALVKTGLAARIRRWASVGYRGALGGGVPDAGVSLLYHQRKGVEAPAMYPCVKTCVIFRHNDQWRIRRPAHHPEFGGMRARRAMMYYVTGYWANRACLSPSSPPIASATLIGSALAKPLTDWKCSERFCGPMFTRSAISGDVLRRLMHANLSLSVRLLIFVIGVLHQLVTPIQWVMMFDTVVTTATARPFGDQVLPHVARAEIGFLHSAGR